MVYSVSDPQNGQPYQYPVEHLEFEVEEGGYYGVVVDRVSGPTSIDIELWADLWLGYRLGYVIPQGSILHPADIPAVVAVAALDAGSPFALEPYSSAGPTNGPGGSLAGGITKPDIAGFANVTTASRGPRSGGSPFNGTSAACPHVAGAAALVWSAHPDWTNAQVRSFLETHAVDMGPWGKDNDYGFGRLYLDDPPQASCNYSLSPSSASVVASGGSGQFSVSTASSCSWTASPSVSWATVTGGSSGQGTGTVSYHVAANPNSSPRTGSITVAGQQFAITQAGQAAACTYTLVPTSAGARAEGGSATFSVATTSSCTWAAVPSVSWISITAGASGTGNGTVSYQIAANPGTSSRNGVITVAGAQFGVNQAGRSTSCSYSLTATQTNFPAEGGEGQVLVSMADESCSWTSMSQNTWITVIENPSATGPKVLRFRVDPNTGDARSGSILIAGKTLTITQAKGSGSGSGPYRYLVAGIAHASGAGGSQWRTALGITNTGDRYANLTFIYRSNAGVTTKTGSFSAPRHLGVRRRRARLLRRPGLLVRLDRDHL